MAEPARGASVTPTRTRAPRAPNRSVQRTPVSSTGGGAARSHARGRKGVTPAAYGTPPPTMPLLASETRGATNHVDARARRVEQSTNSLGSQLAMLQPKKVTFARVAGSILVNEFCERLAFYSILSNLVVFLNSRLELDDRAADTVAFLFAGVCYVTPVIGGWVADAHWGRYKTIVVFVVVYLCGMVTLTLSAARTLSTEAGVFVALTLVAMGTGGIKANVSPFGADQFPADSSAERQRFFSYFYWMINCGALLAQSVVAYVQQDINFWIGYTIPTGSMVVCLLSFLIGRKYYVRHGASGSIVSRTIAVLREGAGCCTCCGRRKDQAALAAASSSSLLHESDEQQDSWLDRAKLVNGGSYTSTDVEEVKELARVLPVLATFCVYWMLDNLVNTVFLSQGEVMALTNDGGFTVPVAALGIADAAVIMSLIPLFDKVVYPWLSRRGVVFTMLQRIGIGFALATAGVLCAGLVEVLRLSRVHSGHILVQRVAGRDIVAADLSVFWQIPQYALIGASEVFAATTGLEFAYSQSPRNMKSVVMALYLLTNAVGSFLGAGMVQLVDEASEPRAWVPRNLNRGKLDMFFFLMAGLMVLNLLAYWRVARRYRYRTDPLGTTRSQRWSARSWMRPASVEQPALLSP